MKVLKAIRILGDVAEIIVGASIVVELVERYRAKKKAQVINQTTETADDTNDAAIENQKSRSRNSMPA